jgi:hypothetical protein
MGQVLEKSLPSRARHVLMAPALRLQHITLKVPHPPVITDAQRIILKERSFNSPILHPNSPFKKATADLTASSYLTFLKVQTVF